MLDPESFHPAVAAWFTGRFAAPSPAQAAAWPPIRAGRATLISAPTGSGKTLAAFLAAIDALVRCAARDALPDAVRVVYVSPLKALSADVRINLEEPLAGIDRELERLGLPPGRIRTLVRTGDTPAAERRAMARRPPHILVTTPESLYLLLTSAGGRRMLQDASTLIVDEIHAVAADKRGAHLSLSMARLEHLVRASGGTLQRIGLSATLRPIDELARFLCGPRADGGDPAATCAIVDASRRRRLDLALELPASPLTAVTAGDVWNEIHARLTALIEQHRSTIVFVNTRRMAERISRALGERLGAEVVAAHHGSLAREQRQQTERRLKAGELRAIVATASLELGIDVGSVDLVCGIGSPRAIATALQRVGRSGHVLGGVPRGRIFPLSRDELVECAALLDAIRRDELEHLAIPRGALDILAQQLVAAVAAEEWCEDDLYALARSAWPYRDLPRADFDAVVEMVAAGFATRRGRRGALLHRDTVHGRLRARRGARLVALTCGGAIPDTADYRVVQQPQGVFVGTLNEDFAIESSAGDVFQLGNAGWRILRVEQGRVLVEDARGAAPSIPFWLGEAPGRSDALSHAVSRLRREVGRRLAAPDGAAAAWLADEVGTGAPAAAQLVAYLAAGRAALGTLPDRERLVLERFFDEAGDQHLVFHAPYGSRVNRAWGLALRKRFCRSFNFELQAAATEDAIVLSLGPTHSFPAADAFGFLHSGSVRELLVQALLDAPVFPIRFRWNASRALALPRWRAGRRVPPRLQRMEAEDLLALVFPDQLACLENIAGDREIPDHPLVRQTIDDCLTEALDVVGLESLLAGIETGRIAVVTRELTEPSPLAHEALTARPYAFLDDAPLEERRTQAVRARGWIDAATAADLGRLDAGVIDRVRAQAWPQIEGPDELHDALLTLGFMTPAEGRAHAPAFAALAACGRATVLAGGARGVELWVAAERLAQARAVHAAATLCPPLALAPPLDRPWEPEAALAELLRGRLSAAGPIGVAALAAPAGVAPAAAADALAELQRQGYALAGRFTPGATEEEWCERGLLARIHRGTLDGLRREIEPASPAHFMRFLLAWQRVDPAARAEGQGGLALVLAQLEGFETAAGAWEGEVLPARLAAYDPAWLDALCLAGRIAWGRAGAPGAAGQRPIRTTPIALLPRATASAWRAAAGDGDAPPSTGARAVLDLLARRGASFFDEIVAGTGLLRTQVEQALAELVARGAATADSFTGLRALLTPSDRRPALDGKHRAAAAVLGMEHAGRWSRLEPSAGRPADAAEIAARALLARYGVVFRRVLERESLAPPWRELLAVYRRLEARGEIRGGRFVDGFTGEQYALPEAVGQLRAVRRRKPDGALISVSAADPLNLAGLVTPGDRVPALPQNRILYRDGAPLAILESGASRLLAELPAPEAWEARQALVRRRIPPLLRAYLGRSA